MPPRIQHVARRIYGMHEMPRLRGSASLVAINAASRSQRRAHHLPTKYSAPARWDPELLRGAKR